MMIYDRNDKTETFLKIHIFCDKLWRLLTVIRGYGISDVY